MTGIPYSEVVHYHEHDDRSITADRLCPVCGERITEDADQWGELTTNRYGEHYEAEHVRQDPLPLPPA